MAYVLITHTVFIKSDAEMIVLALLASAAVVCVWGLLQYNAGIDTTAERWIDGAQFPGLKTRVFSTLGNPNVLAAFLVMIAGLAAGWALDPHHGKRTLMLALLTVLAMGCILLTYSRGAWLTIGVMAMIMIAVRRRWSWRVLLAGAAFVAILWLLAQESFLARLLSIRGMFNPADSSVALRWALWESTLAMIAEHPWIGLGWGSYRFVYPEYDFFVQNEAVIIYHGHNTLLSLAAEIGIPGMLCFAVSWAMAAVRVLVAMKNACRRDKGFYLGIALALLGMAAFSLTDHVLFNIQVASVFWILLAIAASLPTKDVGLGSLFWVNKNFSGVAGFFGSHEKSGKNKNNKK
jgi:putative inorganic carbon (hco3(-)) transporter